MEDDANEFGHIACMNDVVTGACAYENRGWQRSADVERVLTAVGSAVGQGFGCERDDDLKKAARHNVFALMWQIGRARIPKRTNKPGQRRRRLLLQIEHGLFSVRPGERSDEMCDE